MKQNTIRKISRVCVVGGGQMGRLYEELVRLVPSVTEVCIVEPGIIYQDFIDRKVTTYDSLKQLEMSTIDMFCICTPTNTHADLIREIFEGNNHALIICEKPLARTSIEIRNLLADFPDIDSRLVCAMVEHFNEPNIAARTWATSLQSTSGIQGTLYRRTKRPQSNWTLDYAQSGGVLLDLTIHDIDFVFWLHNYSDVILESATVKNDTIEIILKAGNSTYSIHSAWDIPDASESGIMSGISLRSEKHQFIYDSESESLSIDGRTKKVMPRFPHAYQQEIAASTRLKSRSVDFPTIAQCLTVLEFIEDIETQLKRGA